MNGRRFLQTIRLKNIFSFGPDMEPFPLEPLNVLIGPNASGKSNLIEALSLLHAAPDDLQEPIREGGGIHEWLWKGARGVPTATVEVTVAFPTARQMPLRYRLSFTETGGRFELRDEVIEREKVTKRYDSYYQYREGSPTINVKVNDDPSPKRSLRRVKPGSVKPDQSILSQRQDPDSYPELYLADLIFGTIRFYRGFNVGRDAPVRLPQKPDAFQGFLLEDASNLSLVLSNLRNKPDIKSEILERLRDFYPSVEDFVPRPQRWNRADILPRKGLAPSRARHAALRRDPSLPLPAGSAQRSGPAHCRLH